MTIIIGSNFIRSNTELRIQPAGTESARYLTNGIRFSNNRVPAFTASGNGGWRYRDQMGGSNSQWSNIQWQVSQQGAGSFGFNAGQGRYYAPVSGRYYFYASSYMYCDNNSTGCYMHFMFGVNGNRNFNNGREPYSIYGHGTPNNYVDGIVHSTNVSLTQGQYVSLQTPWASNSSRVHGNHTLFCGCFMG